MTTGIYVSGEYVQRLQTLFQQNKINVSFRETVRLIVKTITHPGIFNTSKGSPCKQQSK